MDDFEVSSDDDVAEQNLSSVQENGSKKLFTTYPFYQLAYICLV